jgi:hypothetical protein
VKNFSKGVSYYTGATVSLVFPEDDLCCYRCPLMGIELKVDREYCKMTSEILVAPRDLVGNRCPLVFHTEEENDG